MISKLHKIRYELFFFSQIAILFGSLIIPVNFFDEIVMPALFLSNVFFGVILMSKKKNFARFFSFLLFILLLIYGTNVIKNSEYDFMAYLRFGIYFLFYTIVSIEIIKQVLKTKSVSKNVIIGLMSGYLSIGLISFFIFVSIEIASPGSFDGLMVHGTEFSNKIDSLLYYSYITLLTIGYGDIVPITPIAQKASVLVGVIGQFYIVIVTTIVVEKYIFYRRK